MTDRVRPLRHGNWFRSAVFYEIPVRSFFDSNGDGIGDLPGVTAKLDYLADLGVGAVWLLPYYPSPWRDEGYDVADHYAIHPQLGTIGDLDRLVEEAHRRGIRVLGDYVMNHVSTDHPWFQEARRDRSSPFRSWFLWSDTGTEFSRARVIFRDSEGSNWSWDPVAGQYFFHRFTATQADLNYDTPAVRAEMLNVARFWLGHGLDGFRCDAVPYLIKREGTRCQSLPEVHRYFRELRALLDREFPGTVLVAEANQSIPETVPYFGDGREFQMVMHFPLMPNLFLALGEEDPRRVRHVLRATLPAPGATSWAYFLRNHDEVTGEQLSDDEREMLLWFYGRHPRAVLNGGLRRRLAPMLDGDDRRIEMMTALLLGLPGAPFLYYGDEIGMGDRPDLPDRDGVRTPMQWSDGPTAGFSTAPADRLVRPLVTEPRFGPAARSVEGETGRPGSLLERCRTLLRVRNARAEAFSSPLFEALETPGAPVLAFVRPGASEHVLCLYNFASTVADVQVRVPAWSAPNPTDLLDRGIALHVVDGALGCRLDPFGFAWVGFPPVPTDPGAATRDPG